MNNVSKEIIKMQELLRKTNCETKIIWNHHMESLSDLKRMCRLAIRTVNIKEESGLLSHLRRDGRCRTRVWVLLTQDSHLF